MKNIKNFINNNTQNIKEDFAGAAVDVLTGEASFYENDLEKTFRELIDDATYNLKKDFGVNKKPAEVAEIVINAMQKYKNFK